MVINELTEQELLEMLRQQQGHVAFKALYNRFWEQMFRLALKKCKNELAAEEIVQEVFISLWERRKVVEIANIRSWLLNAVKYKVINYFKSQIIHEKYLLYLKHNYSDKTFSTEQLAVMNDLKKAIDKGIAMMPAKTQRVFTLSRQEQLSTKEIAAKLGITEKAVEYHITQSLRHMRLYLKDYMIAAALAVNIL